jgi:hypothetical protein
MKQYKTTTVDGYLLILDENKDIEENMYTLKDGEIIEVSYLGQDNGNAIIAHLPLNNSPILEGVPLLPSIQEEDDVEKLAKIDSITLTDYLLAKEHICMKKGFVRGYKKAKEKFKHTEHEIRMAYMQGYNRGLLDMPNEMENYIQSIQQPKLPVAFNCEEEEYKSGEDGYGYYEWIGEWVY